MKLIYIVTERLALALLPILALWSVVFYFAMVDEINDETDDSLEDYAELIIRRTLAGRELPAMGDGSNNSFFIQPLGVSVGSMQPTMAYSDSLVYIPEKRETEPARVFTADFADARGEMFRLVVTTPTFERDDLLSSLLWHIVSLFLIVMLTIFLATLFVFYRTMTPLYRLLSWLGRYSPGKGVGDFPPSSSVVEFDKLMSSARDTITRAENYFEQQKQFIGNASHELQTPLAVIGNRIEWMLNETTLTDEQAAELFKMQQSLRKLVRMNRTLLLLAKIDNGQFPDAEPLNLVPLIKNEADLYAEVYAEQSIACSLDVPDSFTVCINAELATILVSNLLKNAFLHSPCGSLVTVSVVDNSIVIANDGDAPLDEQRLFERFYKSGKSGSTGLGLALVGSIARYYGFTVEYAFVDGRHCFTVKF